MAWTTTDLKLIEDAIANGTLSVKYADKEVTYRSIDDLIKVRELIRKQLGITKGQTDRVYCTFDKGLK